MEQEEAKVNFLNLINNTLICMFFNTFLEHKKNSHTEGRGLYCMLRDLNGLVQSTFGYALSFF